AKKPIYKLIISKQTTGPTRIIFLATLKVLKVFASGLKTSAGVFQKTSFQIFIITIKVTKLASSRAPVKIKAFACMAAAIRLILGQKPERGGIPTSDKKTSAKTRDKFGYCF